MRYEILITGSKAENHITMTLNYDQASALILAIMQSEHGDELVSVSDALCDFCTQTIKTEVSDS